MWTAQKYTTPKINIVKPKKASKWAPSEADRMQWILSPTGVPNFQHSALLGGQWHEECGDQDNTIEGQFGEQILKAWDRAVEPWIQGTPTNYLKMMGKPPPKSTVFSSFIPIIKIVIWGDYSTPFSVSILPHAARFAQRSRWSLRASFHMLILRQIMIPAGKKNMQIKVAWFQKSGLPKKTRSFLGKHGDWGIWVHSMPSSMAPAWRIAPGIRSPWRPRRSYAWPVSMWLCKVKSWKRAKETNTLMAATALLYQSFVWV